MLYWHYYFYTFQTTLTIMYDCKSKSAIISPPMVLSWNSWNWPLTKRSTKLDLPTADSPSSTSLNWQILFAAVAPFGLVGPPPRPAIDRDRGLQVEEMGWKHRSRRVRTGLGHRHRQRARTDAKTLSGKNRVERPRLPRGIKTWKISGSN